MKAIESPLLTAGACARAEVANDVAKAAVISQVLGWGKSARVVVYRMIVVMFISYGYRNLRLPSITHLRPSACRATEQSALQDFPRPMTKEWGEGAPNSGNPPAPRASRGEGGSHDRWRWGCSDAPAYAPPCAPHSNRSR